MRPPGVTSEIADRHRTDIDGLRALAVLPVVFYHAKFGCPGGFIGVDIFFVISGYLICSLILKEQAKGVFSLVNFWERRIRRIFPALALVVFATILGGWLLFSSEDFNQLGISVVSQALLLSNVHFYHLSLTAGGYFAPVSETRPLVHTWSLAVEEQFYLFFPLLLIFLSRFRRAASVQVVATLALASFFYCVYQTVNPVARTAAFYLLPSRAWELLLGAMLAMLIGRLVAGPLVREAAGWTGVVLVCAAIFFYGDRTPFPGVAAFPPCLGAALIIFSSETQPSLVGRLLSWKPVVFIGLISYSLYLWHWPLLVFLRSLATDHNSIRVIAALIVASTALAALSWKFVETPFRKRRLLPGRTPIMVFGAATTILLLAVGWFIRHEQGMVWRLDKRFIRYADSRSHRSPFEFVSIERALTGHFVAMGMKEMNQPLDILVWGDSHAWAIAPVLDELCREESKNAALVSFGGVPPVLSSGHYNEADFFFQGTNYDPAQVVLDYIMQKHPRTVIMVAYWASYKASDSFKTQLLATVRRTLASGAKVYVVKDVPTPPVDPPRALALMALFGRDLETLGVTPAQWQEANHNLSETFDQVSKIGASVLDPAPFFLNHKGLYGVIKNDEVLYIDAGHLSVEGAKMLAPLFVPTIQTK